MATPLQARIADALSRVRHPRTGTDVMSAEAVRDIATTTTGKVKLTLLLAPGDDPVLAKFVRQALENVEGVTDVQIEVGDASAEPPKKPASRALPVMNQAPAAPARAAAPTPVLYPNLGRIIAVSSGKGGVGKSTVAVNLAVSLARKGARVGLMDADIYGPNIPRMMGVNDPPMVINERIIPLEAHGVKVISIGLLIDPDQPAIWRGPIVMKILTQFIRDVAWGELDFFIVDMPPGTGDAQLSLVQATQVSGAIIVTTPQEVSVGDALRGVRMFERVTVPVLGIVENMSWLECPHCGKPSAIFGSGGGERLAKTVNLPLLGQIPLYARVMEGGDHGLPIVVGDPSSSAARVLDSIADRVQAWAGGSGGHLASPSVLDPAQVVTLPVETHEGFAPVALVGDGDALGLVSDSLRATIIRVALPAVASSLLMTLFSSVDAFWVGTRIGSDGLAAVSTSLFWIWMIVSLAEMTSVGLTAVAARRYGERRADEASRLSGDALVFTVVIGVIVAIVGTNQLHALFAVMETPASVTALGSTYLRTYLIGTPLIYGFFAVDAAFRASGDTRTPFVLLLSSVAVTLVLDPVLILGLGPFPKLGIAGAAIATIGTRGTVFIMGTVIAMRRGLIRVGRVRMESIVSVCRVGLPTAMTGIMFSLIYVFLTRTTTRFGTPALAALGIGHRVESWLFMIGVGFGAATAAIVGQNLGAGKVDRASRAGWLAAGFCTMLGVVTCILELVFPRQFASLFTTDAAVIAEAVKYLRIAAISQVAVCAEIVLEGALGGAGHTVPPMLASTALTASRIPLAAWAATRWGSAGIWWVICLTAVGRGGAMAALWRSGGWKRRSV